VSETTELLESAPSATSARGKGLSGMVLPDLKVMASQLGIKGTSAMRKGDLIAAISARQGGDGRSGDNTAPSTTTSAQTGSDEGAQRPPRQRRSASRPAGSPEGASDAGPAGTEPAASPPPATGTGSPDTNGSRDNTAAPDSGGTRGSTDTVSASATGPSSTAPSSTVQSTASEPVRAPERPRADAPPTAGDNGAGAGTEAPERPRTDRPATGGDNGNAGRPQSDGDARRDQPAGNSDRPERSGENADRSGGGEGQSGSTDEFPSRDRSRRNRRNRRDRDRATEGSADNGDGGDRPSQPRQSPQNRDGGSTQNNGSNRDQNRSAQSRETQNRDSDDDFDGDGTRRGRRYRDRNRRGRERFTETPGDTEVRDDDVLLPVAGILDVLDSYAFVRTSGYLTGSNDVYVSLSQVRKYHLRRGDAVTGAVRAPRESEAARQKFNALVRLDSVNGLDPEQAKNRPEFTKLTPLYPNERLRLETEAHILTTRVIDLVMPVGKGQRALIVSPPKAGKTSVLQAIANAISTNNPECHLMVVLVDERPEEVTDMQRSVKGEVIASTFDRPPADHTQVAELAIERAKRLVEMGKDVVVLLDSITRLGRAYNLAAPASGRILSGGVDSTALFPPKRFLGAARNIENGGSLTIFASALVETGSAGDTVIFEEFKGTGNAELKLDRRIADKRVFPAIDIDQSSTRKEDLLMSPDEHAVVIKLRRVLGALESQAALDLVLGRLRKTRSNVEFLMQVAATTPNADRD
jgi:transcription termination factor Rho